MSSNSLKTINTEGSNTEANNICACCHKVGRYRCSGCKQVVYCSAICQKKHWPSHRDECIQIRQKARTSEKKTPRHRISKKGSPSPPNRNEIKIPANTIKSFDFYEKLKYIMLSTKVIDKVTILHSMIPFHRKHLIDYVLIKPGESVYFKWTSYLYDVYSNIEGYIYHYCILIKYLIQNPNQKINLNTTLSVITQEIFEGVLSFSMQMILDRCAERFRGKALEPVRYGRMILINYLKLVSFFIKLSKMIYNGKLFIKYLNYYGFIFDIFLTSFKGKKKITENILKSNLYYNIANAYIKETYLTIGIKLYNQCIAFQKKDDIIGDIIISCNYNLSVLYYIMDNLKQSELCLNEALEMKTREVNVNDNTSLKYKKSQLQLLKILIFTAEIKIETDNLDLAIKYLKSAVELIKDLYSKKEERNSNTDSFNPYTFYSRTNTCVTKSKAAFSRFYQRNSIEEHHYYPNNTLNNSLDNFQTIRTEDNNNNQSTSKSTLYEELEKAMATINGLFDKILYLKNEKESMNSPYTKFNNLKNPITQSRTMNMRGSRYIPSKRMSLATKNNYSLLSETNPTAILNPIYIPQSTSDKVLSYLKETLQKKKKLIDKEYDVSDFKNFFLLLTRLSLHQIEILNETQSTTMPMSLYKNLPILFSKQFKNSLNPAQRSQLDKLKVLSLIRCRVLKDVNKPISLDNLRYEAFHTNISFNEFQQHKYSELKEIVAKVSNVSQFPLLSHRRYNSNLFSKNEDEDSPKQLAFEAFRYNDQYDINKLKNMLISKIQEDCITYSQEEINDMIILINSNIFVKVLNEMKLSEIIELENEPDVILLVLQEKIKEKNKEAIPTTEEDFEYNFDGEEKKDIEEEENEDEDNTINSPMKKATKTFSQICENSQESRRTEEIKVDKSEVNKGDANRINEKEEEYNKTEPNKNNQSIQEEEVDNTIFNPTVMNEINNTTPLKYDGETEDNKKELSLNDNSTNKKIVSNTKIANRYEDSDEEEEEEEEESEDEKEEESKKEEPKIKVPVLDMGSSNEEDEEDNAEQSIIDDFIS